MSGGGTPVGETATAPDGDEARRSDSETYVRDEALEGPEDEGAETLPTIPAPLAGPVETRATRNARLAEAAAALLRGRGAEVTRSSLAKASEEVDDDPTRLPRGPAPASDPAGMPPAPAVEGPDAPPSGRPRYRGFVESTIDSNAAVRRIYEANAKPSNLRIGKARGRKAKRKRGVAVVPAHVMRRLKRDIARDYMTFRKLAERRRLQLVHANAVILELRKTQHRKDAKREAAGTRRGTSPSNDQ